MIHIEQDNITFAMTIRLSPNISIEIVFCFGVFFFNEGKGGGAAAVLR